MINTLKANGKKYVISDVENEYLFFKNLLFTLPRDPYRNLVQLFEVGSTTNVNKVIEQLDNLINNNVLSQLNKNNIVNNIKNAINKMKEDQDFDEYLTKIETYCEA